MNQRISARDCLNYVKCKYRVYQDSHSNVEDKDSIDVFLGLLWDGEVPHHEKALAYFNAQADKVLRTVEGESDEITIAATSLAMKEGVDYIYKGVVSMAGENTLFEQRPSYIAYPDILMKVEGVSLLGDYMYVPVMFKAGSGIDETDWGDRPDPSYSAELVMTSLILEHMIGCVITNAFVYSAFGEMVSYRVNSSESHFKKILIEATNMVTGKRGEVAPVIGSLCGLCPWQSSCSTEAEKSENLTLLFYLGEKVRDGFISMGIHTLSDLAKEDAEKLVSRVREAKYKGVFYKSFSDVLVRSLVLRAGLYLQEKGENKKRVFQIRGVPDFPSIGKELHYDIEDDPVHGDVYMHGFWVIEEGKDSYYKAFVAMDGKTEEDIARELWAFFAENPAVPVYHYSGHEVKTCKKLMEKYGLSKDIFNAVFAEGGAAIDLYDWVSAHTDWPLTSYGLKPICKYTGFAWSAEDAGGANSISWYDAYLHGEKEKMDKILTYNKEDCMATAHLKEWLVSHSK